MKPYIFALSLLLATGCATTQGTRGIWQDWPSETQVTSTTQAILTEMSAGRLGAAATLSMEAVEPQDLYLRAETTALQGDLPQAIARFVDLIERYPDSVYVSAALSRILMLSQWTRQPLDWEKIASLRVHDAYALSRLVVLQNQAMREQPNQAELVHPTAMPLVQWRWVGPFTPHVRTGFVAEQPFDADTVLAEQYEVQGMTLTPFRYPAENRTVMAASRVGVYAGETTIRTDKKMSALVVVWGTQLYDLKIDGKSVLKREMSDFGQNNILAVPVELDAGDHAVRMKLGLMSTKNGAVRVWVVPTGKDAILADLSEHVHGGNTSKNGVKVGKRVDLSHVLGQVMDPVPDDALRVWLGAMHAVADGKVQIADALIRKRLEQSPEDRMAMYWRAMRNRMDADLDPGIRSENSIEALRVLGENAPEMAHAHMVLIQEFLKQHQPKQAFEVWNTHRTHLPENGDMSVLMRELTQALDWDEISEQYAMEAAQMVPDSCRLAVDAMEIQHRKHQYTAFEAMSPRLQQCPSVVYTWAKLEGDDAAGDSNRWHKAIEQLSALHPNDVRLRLMAIQQRVATDPKGAIEAMYAHLDAVERGFYPALATDAALEFVDRLRVQNLDAEADQLLTRLMSMYPADETLHNLGHQMHQTRPFEDLRVDGMQIIRDYLAQNRTDAGSSVMILDYAATRMMPNGAKLGITHQISRVLSKEGKNAVGEIYLPRAASVLKIRTIKDGTFEVIEPESIDFKDSVTAPNLAIGDFVEVEYVTFEAPTSVYTHRVVSDVFFYGSDASPIVNSSYVYEYPKDWDIDVIESGPAGQIETKCVPHGDWMRCTASRLNIPVLIPEPRAASGYDIIPNLQVYHRYDWEAVRSSLYESVTRQSRITPYVEQFFEQIGVPEEDSVYAYARAIYDTVVHRIDEDDSGSGEGESATRSVTKGVGSRVITLKAMYDLAGIPSYFALVRSVLSPKDGDKWPSRYSSAYATMLVVETEKGLAYVQPSEDFVPFDYLGLDFNAQEAIPLDPDRAQFTTRRDDLEDLRASIDIEYQIAEDGSASAQTTEVMRGTRAMVMRNFFTMLKNDTEKSQQVVQNSLANSYGRTTLKRLDTEHLEDKNVPLTMYYDFDIASFAAVSDNKLEILSRIFAYQLVKQYAPLSPEERKFDVMIDHETISKRTLTFHAPAGYQWQTDTLQDVVIETPFGKFTRKMTLQGEDMQLSESITLVPQRVKVEDYAAFRAFCLAVDEAQRTVMVMTK